MALSSCAMPIAQLGHSRCGQRNKSKQHGERKGKSASVEAFQMTVQLKPRMPRRPAVEF